MPPGTSLGVYEILALIGAGGMGEVYRARDTTLNRDVALKILPEAFARDADRLARFKREAQVLASLNHPNIAAIHGLEESEGRLALVLELVEGPTLEQMLTGSGLSALGAGKTQTRQALPLESCLAIARQIAEALEHAHAHGVVHRDLKPANIKVRPDGTVKVLDFGLAKAMEAPGSGPGASGSDAATITSPAVTARGVILGTAAYMSPEQARGEAVDHQTDIWAFGCVLFEMLTGRRPFDGRTVSDAIAAVLRAHPDWTMLPRGLHPRVRMLLDRCLEKDAALRYHHIADARVDVLEAIADPSPAHVESGSGRSRQGRTMVWAAAAAAIAAVATGAAVWIAKPSPAPRIERFAHVLRDGEIFSRLV